MNKFNNIKAVIFDMDGLMINSEPLWTEMEIIYLCEKGIDYKGELHYELMGLKQEEAVGKFKELFKINETLEQIINRRLEILFELYEEKLSLTPYLLDLIAVIEKKGLRLALASGSPLHVIKWVLQKFDLLNKFNPVVSADDVERGKPEPDIYRLTLKLLGLKPDECVVLEDSFNGVKSAVSAEIPCISVPDPADPSDFSMADFMAKDLLEVKELLVSRFFK